MTPGIVIVGGGQAGFQVAASLRAGGYPGPITLVGAETVPPYQRPPLSKAYLLGKTERERLLFRQEAFYREAAVELMLGETVTAIDRGARTIVTGAGRHVPYERLVLATGTRVRSLPVEGTELGSVLYLRTLADADALATALAEARRVVVIGGGFIGLEVAASARTLGKEVTVLEAAPRLMGRVVAPVISAFFWEMHGARGVEVVLDARIQRLVGEGGRVTGVEMADGTVNPADLVVVGIGVVPNVELAVAAGLEVADGILVDEHGVTSDPLILACGECTSHPNRFAGGRARLESVQNAVDQAKAVAATLLGRDEPYDAVPWFWSDQYDLKLQMVGISKGHDASVLRGDPASGRFSVFYFKERRLLAIDSVNRASDHMLGRRLLQAGTALDPEQASDEAFDLKSALSS